MASYYRGNIGTEHVERLCYPAWMDKFMASTKKIVGGLGLSDLEPIFVWCYQYPSVTKPPVRSKPVMELPSKTAVLGEGEVLKRNVPENGREAGLQSDPQWILGTDEDTYCGKTQPRSSAVVEK